MAAQGLYAKILVESIPTADGQNIERYEVGVRIAKDKYVLLSEMVNPDIDAETFDDAEVLYFEYQGVDRQAPLPPVDSEFSDAIRELVDPE